MFHGPILYSTDFGDLKTSRENVLHLKDVSRIFLDLSRIRCAVWDQYKIGVKMECRFLKLF